MPNKHAKFLNDYIIDGFILIEDKNSNQCCLAYGLFCVETNKNFLAHYEVNFDSKTFYVLTDKLTCNKLLRSSNRCEIKEQFELNDLTQNEREFYLYNDPSKQIYKELYYSIFPDLDPRYSGFDLI